MTDPAPATLEDVRIIDLTTGSWNYAGRLLAGLGAEVVKVEPPEGDPVRRWAPFSGDLPHAETGAHHLHLDGGKRSVALSLDDEEGRAVFRSLVRSADVVLESFAPGYLAARGLAYDDLAAERPGLVMASVTHFGQDGPYASFAGSEIVDCALGGYLGLTGDPDREPVKPYGDLVIQHAALHAAAAVVAGLHHRDTTGEGDHFDVAAIDAATYLLGGPAQTYFFDGDVPRRAGTRLLFTNPQYSYPSTIRPCKDGYVHAHSNNRNADLLAVLMPGVGLETLLDRPMGNADAIDACMDRWLAQYDKFEVVRMAQAIDLPFTEVLTPEEILNDPHLEARGFLVDVEHPVAPPMRVPGPAIRMTETPWRTERAPLLGEDTDDVLRDVLGLDDEALRSLRARGVVA
jgi:crotonobetainyl-CoA:carnitine CoA-transferase CaiB-like acyl-CoA transferase